MSARTPDEPNVSDPEYEAQLTWRRRARNVWWQTTDVQVVRAAARYNGWSEARLRLVEETLE